MGLEVLQNYEVDDIKKLATRDELLERDLMRLIASDLDEVRQQRSINAIHEQTSKLHITREWDKLYKEIKLAIMAERKAEMERMPLQPIEVHDAPVDGLLLPRGWQCSDDGIRRQKTVSGVQTWETVVPHPLLLISRLADHETIAERVEIAWRRDGVWKTAHFERTVIYDRHAIMALAGVGIMITSTTAPDVVDWFAALEIANMGNKSAISVKKTVDHFGWFAAGDDDMVFAPYSDNLTVFSPPGLDEQSEAIETKGSYDVWKALMRDESRRSMHVRICLAAAYAAPLVGLLKHKCYAVNLWGETGYGKTNGLMAALSVYGDPKRYYSYNATSVGLERYAAFRCNLPIAIDEYKTSKDSKKAKGGDTTIYDLTEGVTRLRGRKQPSAIEKQQYWYATIISTSEHPLTSEASDGGAVNRVIEIYVDKPVFSDDKLVMPFLLENYGYAGREYIDFLIDTVKTQGLDKIRKLHNSFWDRIRKSNPDIANKQAPAAAMLALGAMLGEMAAYGLNEIQGIEVGNQICDWVTNYLATTADVSPATRAYEQITSWVATNRDHFVSTDGVDSFNGTYGKVDKYYDNIVHIIKPVLDKMLVDNGYHPQAVIKSLVSKKLITEYDRPDKKGKIPYKRVKIGGQNVYCYKIALPDEDAE